MFLTLRAFARLEVAEVRRVSDSLLCGGAIEGKASLLLRGDVRLSGSRVCTPTECSREALLGGIFVVHMDLAAEMSLDTLLAGRPPSCACVVCRFVCLRVSLCELTKRVISGDGPILENS